MAKRLGRFHRRQFLRVGAAGLAALGSGSWKAGLLTGGELAERRPPRSPVVLRSAQLELTVAREDGLPYEYRLLARAARFRGEDFGEKIRVTLCRLMPRGFVTVPLTASSVETTGTQADFHFEAAYEGKPDERIAFYSLTAKRLSAPMPKGWDANRIATVSLGVEKSEEIHAHVEGGEVSVLVPARRPVMVYRYGEKARKRLLETG